MKKSILFILVLFQLSCKGEPQKKTKNKVVGKEFSEYQLVWQDEFDSDGTVDATKWDFEKGYIRNHEQQYYTDRLENARIENGTLVIEALNEKVKNENFVSSDVKNWKENQEYARYTSASITTKNLAEWTYGKIEVRAKLPKGRGAWPAIWMLGKNWKEVGWPRCGEIDIMEHVGFNKDSIFGTVHTETFNHTKDTEVGKSLYIDTPYDKFHIYSIEWTPEKINFLLDEKIYHQFENRNKTDAEWPFDQPFHLKLNIAIGGDWGGQQGIDDRIFPQQMIIDYVRVHQLL